MPLPPVLPSVDMDDLRTKMQLTHNWIPLLGLGGQKHQRSMTDLRRPAFSHGLSSKIGVINHIHQSLFLHPVSVPGLLSPVLVVSVVLGVVWPNSLNIRVDG